MKIVYFFAMVGTVAAAVGLIVFSELKPAKHLTQHLTQVSKAERKVSPPVRQGSKAERKPVNREILESAERLSRTLENCKTTVKTNSVTR